MIESDREIGMNGNPVHLYFHSPCFDGVVSAALTSDYLEHVKGYRQVHLQPVNYHLRDSWLQTTLNRPCAVVDFLYQPLAEVWADHHATTFLNDAVRHDYERRSHSEILYDRSASSCALLLWKYWHSVLPPHRASHYVSLIKWADRIDSARYESVDEAIGLKAPALQINLALAMYRGEAFSQHLAWLFRTESLESVAMRPEVHTAFAVGLELQQLGEKRLSDNIHLTDNGIAVYDVHADGVSVNRYAPFYFFPQARYSAGIIRSPGQSKLTVMRNPWIEFPSVALGDLCVSLGGGGHRRVGSVLVRDRDPAELLDQLVRMISAHEKKQKQMVTT